VLLNKQAGLSHAKVAAVFRALFGLDLTRPLEQICREVDQGSAADTGLYVPIELTLLGKRPIGWPFLAPLESEVALGSLLFLPGRGIPLPVGCWPPG
jgi:hypothetical protein